MEEVCKGGSPEAVELHRKRGRLALRDRLDLLCDKGADRIEIGILAGHKMYSDNIPGGGIFTGVCTISGVRCMVIANDPTVKGGTYYPVTSKKHLRAQEIAEQNRLPCVHLVDSGGGYLPLQAQGFADRDMFGRIFYNQATMSSKGIPQISVVLGPCTAGGAYIPCMSDENIILATHGHIFLGGPPLVKAATGEVVSTEELGGAKLHCEVSGVSDYFAATELEAFPLCRELVANLRDDSDDPDLITTTTTTTPTTSSARLLHLIPPDATQPLPMRDVIPHLAMQFTEFKQRYGTSLITGFGRIQGRRVGIIANNGGLTGEGATKGAHFIQLCEQREVPMLFIHDAPHAGDHAHTDGDFKRIGHMIAAVSTSSVPKVVLMAGGSFGISNFALAGRSFSPNFVLAWPRARLGLDPAAAAPMSALEAAARMHVDMVVNPADTAATLAHVFDACYAGVRERRKRKVPTNFRL